ncbi:MAG: RDD family protein [Nibricoccus sp.]
MPWYYANNNQRLGPVSDSEFARLAREKIIREETLVWKHGMADWKTYAEVESTLPPPEIRTAPSVEPSVGDMRPAASFESVNVSAILGERVNYAGFWIRVAAKLIDWVILWGIAQVLTRSLGLGDLNPFDILQMSPEAMQPLFQRIMLLAFLDSVIRLAFYWFFLKKFAATPGKMIFGLQVISTRGDSLGTGQIVGRYFSEVLAKYFTLCIGYIVAGFDSEKRAMHDHFCDTRVVYKRKH